MKTPSHTEIARDYKRKHDGDTIYTRGLWWRYGGGVWSELNENTFDQEVWSLLEEYELRFELRPSLNAHRSISAYLRANLYIPENQVDANPNHINLTNGVFDLTSQVLLSHNPLFYLTTQLPFAYDPTATAPDLDYFVDSTLVQRDLSPDPDLAALIQEAVGYSLTVDNQYHVTFWLYGEGENGKGTLFHMLERLAGSAATPLNVNILRKEQYQLASLAGKRIALCAEVAATDNLVADDLIKSLVHGDTIQARQIRGVPFSLQPVAKLWWSMNDLPPVADLSRGFWRSILVIPFNRQFADHEKRYDLRDCLDQQLPGIFNWALAGLNRLRQRGAFEIPAQVQQLTAQYQRSNNTVLMWVEDCCDLSNGGASLSSVLYDSYKAWSHDNGYRPFSIKNFKRELNRMKIFDVRRNQGTFFDGIKLRI